MNDTLLCKCPNNIIADTVCDILNVNGIESRRHDETMDQRTGAYGPVPGIAIYVFEKDLERAQALTRPVFDNHAEDTAFICPKCGSENVEPIMGRKDNSALLIAAVFFFLFPGLYLFQGEEYGIKSEAVDVIAIILFVAGLVIMFTYNRVFANYHCKDCGKKFHHL
ncbi:Putative signal transducing protein [Bacteroidales bacterium WCE2008]|nr:DUF2007 domain-containing protein [Bacteroidales bacterium]MBQ3996683.1 DUF2007 domain-containing protein [Bacteroidales bacterium]MBR5955473.1 DUF2007 domain-containing protein [Bacteroidales bacterium]MEE3462760.1 DUF2007 domain-containing protein [Candidatus Cryptobacteroides sp.]SKC34922.1 Putative signal transducing protein [Bacteroidales bacterium WCE2008]